MSEERKPKKNSIFIRVFGNYVGLVLLFAFVLGFIFISLFNNSNIRHRGQQMTDLATNTAERLRQYIIDKDYDMRYSEALGFLELFAKLEDVDIWTVADENADDPLDKSLVTIDLDKIELQEEFTELINNAFSGQKEYKDFYSDIHGKTVIACGVPIYANVQEPCGAVILIRNMEETSENTRTGVQLITMSTVIALIIASIVSLLFTGQITRPVMRIEKVTKSLSEGDYTVKTGISRNDEIGSMARSIDSLAERLELNENERKNMEQIRLDFFANVSHELRTPITVVRAYIESLVDGVITDEKKVRQYYERILKETTSMERLVGDLLTLSKMQNPNFVINKEPVNLVDVFEEVVRSALAISNEKGIKIHMHRENNVYMMLGDYDRLRQLFMVVLDNAVKFSPQGANIYMSLKSEKRKLVCSVRDEGSGISREELPNIFEKFYKSKLRQNEKGTGLGLPIAKYITEKHGGKVDVVSTVGVGTEFIFTFDEVYEEDL